MVSATTWPWMSIDMAPLMVTMWRLRAMASGELIQLDGQEGDVVVAVQPVVQVPAASGEGGQRDAVVGTLAVGDLAGLVAAACSRW